MKPLHDLYGAFVRPVFPSVQPGDGSIRMAGRNEGIKHENSRRSAVDLAVGELIEAADAECSVTGVDGLVENHRKLVAALAQLRLALGDK